MELWAPHDVVASINMKSIFNMSAVAQVVALAMDYIIQYKLLCYCVMACCMLRKEVV